MLYHLPKLRELARSDFGQQTSSGFVADTEWDGWINEGYYKYAIRLMEMGQGHFETDILLDMVANTESVALPFNFTNQRTFLETVRVERVLPNARVPLNYRRRYNESVAVNAANAGFSYLPTYDFRGNNIILEPSPGQSEVGGLFMVYKALPPRLHSNYAQAGGVATITLEVSADPRDDYYNGSRIMIISGPGAEEMKTITDYVGSTKVATVDANWSVQPTSASIYSTLIHDDFPESFHDLLYLYAVKRGFQKERSMGTSRSYDGGTLKEREKDFWEATDKRSEARTFVQAFHIETEG